MIRKTNHENAKLSERERERERERKRREKASKLLE
jgi:hypothetical protein